MRHLTTSVTVSLMMMGCHHTDVTLWISGNCETYGYLCDCEFYDDGMSHSDVTRWMSGFCETSDYLCDCEFYDNGISS